MWVECANYALSDPEHHCEAELAYLKKNSSTNYTPEEFKRALALEYFPRNMEEVQKEIISDTGKYSIKKATQTVNQYLMDMGEIKTPIPAPKIAALSK